MNSIGIAIKGKNIRKGILFSLLERGNSAVFGNMIHLSSISDSQELRKALEEAVKFEDEKNELSGTLFEKGAEKRLTELPSDEETLASITKGREKSFHLTHLVAMYGDIYELTDFLSYLQTIDNVEDIESIIIMVNNTQPESKYEWVVFSRDKNSVRYFYLDHEAAFSLSVFRKIIDGKLKGSITNVEDSTDAIPRIKFSEIETSDDRQEKEENTDHEDPTSGLTEAESISMKKNTEPSEKSESCPDESISDGNDEGIKLQPAKKRAIKPEKEKRTSVKEKEPVKGGPEEVKREERLSNLLNPDEAISDSLFQDDLAGEVYFLEGGNVYKASVMVRFGTGQVFNYGFKAHKDVLEYVKDAYLQFREANVTVSDKIDCRAYDYSIRYECLTGRQVTSELALPTFIGLCSANLQKPVRRKLLTVLDGAVDSMMMEYIQRIIPGGVEYFLLSDQSSVSARGDYKTFFYESWPNAVKIALSE